jgi:stage II sporulation protein E
MLPELLCAIEGYGAELNMSIKKKIQKQCVHAPQFIKAVLDVYKQEKKSNAWRQKMVESRESCAIQLDAFAKMALHSTRELDASIFADEHLEKKIKAKFQKQGLKLLSTVFFVTAKGKYEIHVTVKVSKGECIATKTIVKMISECAGREMVLTPEERSVVGTEYATIVCVEGTNYHTLQGVAKIGKGCEKISGDNFSMLEMSGGKSGAILSDGMGVGSIAFRESAMVVDVLEELLNAGFPEDTALQMLNTALVMGREEVRFSTIDMCMFDLYDGTCEFRKAGASTTYIKRKDKVECVRSESLPLGVVSKMQMNYSKVSLNDGDMVVMLTDGVLDALPSGEQDFIMKMIVEGLPTQNPKEAAHHILESVLTCSGEIPTDDMTVLVVGIWSLEKTEGIG